MDFSIIVNVDSRPERNNQDGMFNGVVDRDFIIDGVKNKIKYFGDLSKEVIVFIDEHEKLDSFTVNELREIADTVIIRKHNKDFEDQKDFPAFNDLNYLQAIFHARGKYIFHFDGDVSVFAPNQDSIWKQVMLLEEVDYVSYPSHWSPNPVYDESFGERFWVSTRYFCCKRSTINFSEVLKCQLDYDYWKETYPVPRLCHWTEHLLSSISHHTGKGVYYPPIIYDEWILFTWDNYQKGLLKELNEKTFDEVKDFVLKNNGIFYPNNLRV